MTTRRRATLAAASFLCVTVAAAPAAAAPPTIERIVIDDTFEERSLSRACDVPVTVTLSGFRITRTFDDDGIGSVLVSTVNASATLRSGDESIRLRDVGADVLRLAPNGDVILGISGQIPFGWRGVLRVNETTGVELTTPQPSTDVDRVCAALTA